MTGSGSEGEATELLSSESKKVPEALGSSSGTVVCFEASGMRFGGGKCCCAAEFDLDLSEAKVALDSARLRVAV